MTAIYILLIILWTYFIGFMNNYVDQSHEKLLRQQYSVIRIVVIHVSCYNYISETFFFVLLCQLFVTCENYSTTKAIGYQSKYVLCLRIFTFWNFPLINCGLFCSFSWSVVSHCCSFCKSFKPHIPIVVWYFKGWTFFSVHVCVVLGDFCCVLHCVTVILNPKPRDEQFCKLPWVNLSCSLAYICVLWP